MKRFTTGKLGACMIVACGLALFSCKKTFDIKPKSSVDVSDNYRNVFDVNAAIIGIYGQVLGIAEQYVILNELRADMMDVTANADKNLIEISTHNVSPGNPWADPRPFYQIILNCNDVMYHLNLMLKATTINQTDYNQRYSDVGAVRSWLYLQLGIHFGTVPYVTDPLSNIDDLKDLSKFPRIPFPTLINNLTTFVAGLPYLDPYPDPTVTVTTSSVSSSLITTADGYLTKYYFINKRLLLGDLYLWQGNYNLAATAYRGVLETSTDYYTYKTSFADVISNNDLCVGYKRYSESDINSLVNNNQQGWRSIFARSQDALFSYEMIWQMNFNVNFQPVDPFIDLFSNQGGRYLVQPSQTAIDLWTNKVTPFNPQGSVQQNAFPFDARAGFTYQTINGQNVIVKYLYDYLDAKTFIPTALLNRNGRFFLYRGATLDLRFAEAANRDGRGMIAYAFLNQGLQYVLNPVNQPGSGYTFPANGDVTYISNTMPLTSASGPSSPGGPTGPGYTSNFYNDVPPYQFDARNSNNAGPNFRSEWYQQVGVRTRARLNPYPIALENNMLGLEDALILENGLETAYEGHRWEDLLRIALRRNDPSYISARVYDKLSKSSVPSEVSAATTAQAKLLKGNSTQGDGFYLPFNW